MRFTVTEDHVRLARQMYVRWDDCEFGAPAIDPKRPYGNSDVPGDMAKLLGVPFDPDAGLDSEAARRLYDLHHEMETVLQIALRTGSFAPGTYEQERYGDWQPVTPGLDEKGKG